MGTEFKVPLSKVQLFKMKKMLSEQEHIFIENIEGRYFVLINGRKVYGNKDNVD